MLGFRLLQKAAVVRPLVQISTRAASSIPIINDVMDGKKTSHTALVQHPFSLEGYKAPDAPAQEVRDLFAVVDFSGHQYKVVGDDVIVADNMDGYDIGQIVNLDKVLLVGSKTATLVGKPLVNGANVVAVVEELAKDKKVMTLKFRRRKNSKNLRGFRRQVTILRIKEITLNSEDSKDLGV